MDASRIPLIGLAVVLSTSLLGGCMNLSGLDAKSDFTCKAPDGVSCMSISGVSANVDRNNLPKSIKKREKDELTRDVNKPGTEKSSKSEEPQSTDTSAPAAYETAPTVSPATMPTLESGTAIRVPPKEMRIWMAPVEDTDGDLNDQRYIYVVVNDGRWILDAARMNTRNKYTRFEPLVNQSNMTVKPEAGVSPQSDIRPVEPQTQPRPQPQPQSTGG